MWCFAKKNLWLLDSEDEVESFETSETAYPVT
jgi:hypothetical protein